MLYLMFDASSPPKTPYPSCHAVAGYIGGNTPHVWTVEEWLRFSGLAQFPIWVGYNETNPIEHGRACVTAMDQRGWSRQPGNKIRRAVILDYETEINAAWVDAFSQVVWSAGYETIVYGSESTVMSDPAKEGRWIALYNGRMDIPADPHAIAHQYRANVPWDGTAVDLSVVTDTMLAHAGTGKRHG